MYFIFLAVFFIAFIKVTCFLQQFVIQFAHQIYSLFIYGSNLVALVQIKFYNLEFVVDVLVCIYNF
jgi:hypothetical protein